MQNKCSQLPPAGFGLGALNDADEDDIDIYDLGASSRRNRTAYEAGDENRHRTSIGGRRVLESQVNASNVSPSRLTHEHDHYSSTRSPKIPLSRGSEVGNLFCQSLYSQTFQ